MDYVMELRRLANVLEKVGLEKKENNREIINIDSFQVHLFPKAFNRCFPKPWEYQLKERHLEGKWPWEKIAKVDGFRFFALYGDKEIADSRSLPNAND